MCFTLLFKVLVPVGFMPDMAALQHGIYKLTICTGSGAKEITVDQNQKPIDAGQKDSGHKTGKSGNTFCPFAGIHGGAIPVLILALALSLLWRQLRFKPQAFVLQSVGRVSMWPRAPPAFI
jgi:hypothetical protein